MQDANPLHKVCWVKTSDHTCMCVSAPGQARRLGSVVFVVNKNALFLNFILTDINLFPGTERRSTRWYLADLQEIWRTVSPAKGRKQLDRWTPGALPLACPSCRRLTPRPPVDRLPTSPKKRNWFLEQFWTLLGKELFQKTQPRPPVSSTTQPRWKSLHNRPTPSISTVRYEIPAHSLNIQLSSLLHRLWKKKKNNSNA